MLHNSYASTFFYFFDFLTLKLILKMSDEMYGSDGFCTDFLHDERGKIN